MYVCIVRQDGEMRVHRNRQAAPEPFLKAIAPYRDGLVVAVDCLFTWYWLADLCAQEGMPCVLGHALSMKAIHGGKAKNDQIDSQKMATLLRGGMLPKAYGYPAERRAPRDGLRRRPHLMRKRAELLAHVPKTNAPYNVPEIGKKIAYQANREGVAERFDDPAVPKTLEGDLELITYDDQMLSDLALFILQTAQPHDAPPLSFLHTVPGIGTILRLVLRYEMHQLARVPRVQDGASYGRLVKGAQESGGKRWGTAGNTLGHAPLPWAFAEAATLFLRGNEPGQKSLARWETKHDKGKALRLRAHKLARAVSVMLTRKTAFDLEQFLRTYGSRAGEPGASLDTEGRSLNRTEVQPRMAASWNAEGRLGPISLSPAL
jgi:transposase